VSASTSAASSALSVIRNAISPIAFPLAAKYDPEWIRDNALGENALCQAESLARRLPFHAGMRVLDLGCGKATSSIFLAREFGVEAWAADGATSASENRKRAVALGCEASVFPLRVDAHSLPFAKDFFDAAIAIDSYLYYGTDDRYLSYLAQFIKPGGFIGRFRPSEPLNRARLTGASIATDPRPARRRPTTATPTGLLSPPRRGPRCPMARGPRIVRRNQFPIAVRRSRKRAQRRSIASHKRSGTAVIGDPIAGRRPGGTGTGPAGSVAECRLCLACRSPWAT
jgi:SAM-dependent methyltransferase